MSDKAQILEALHGADMNGVLLPEVPPNSEAFILPEGVLADVFRQRLESLSGEVVRVKNAEDATVALAKVINGQTALYDGSSALKPLVGSIYAAEGTHLVTPELEVGITGADALVARTGSVILSSAHAGRKLSALPPTHVVIAWTSQIVATLSDVDLTPTIGSVLSIISGPSRTADIEKILVLGAHGPKRLVVILIDEA